MCTPSSVASSCAGRADMQVAAMTRISCHWRLAFLALLLSIGAAHRPARAQGPAASLAPIHAPAAPKPAEPPVLSPAETRQMLELLNDPQKRAAFTATLETLSKAAKVAGPKAADPVKLAPDSVGAQLVVEGTHWVGGLTGQLTRFGSVLGDLPSVWAFTRRTALNPVLRARAIDAGWRLALVLALAGLGDWGARWLLRRPIRAVAAAAPGTISAAPEPGEKLASPAVEAAAATREAVASAAEPDPQDAALAGAATDLPVEAHAEAEIQHVLRRRRFDRTLRTLARLPFVLLCFMLDLLPLGVFIGIGYAGTLFMTPHVDAVLQAAVLAYTVCRLATAVTAMVFAPGLASLRLVHVDDAAASSAVIWVRRVFAVAAFGYATSQIGLLFGLPQQADDAFLKAVFLVVHLLLIVIVLQCRAPIAARIRGTMAADRLGARIRARVASVWHLVAIFYIAALWLVWAAEVRNGYLRIWHIFLVTAGVLVAARLLAIVLLGGLDRGFRAQQVAGVRAPGLVRANRYLPLLRRLVSAAVIVATSLVLLQTWGINTQLWFRTNALGGRLLSATAAILVAAALALVVWEAINAAMDSHLARLAGGLQLARWARLRTLLPILQTMLLVVLVAIFGLTALSEIGVNIAPLLAGAGILGVAIGFGSQKLVQDFITGIFLLVENAMQVGDWVTVAGLSGAVENLSIRTMRLRAGDGSVHIIPFSSVSTVTNVNRGIGNAAVSVAVPMEEDTDQVAELLGRIAREMRGEPNFANLMRSDFQLWGVDKLEAGVATIVGQIVCSDTGRWAVQREFNRRVGIRFKGAGLRIATPVTTVYTYTASQPAKSTTQNVGEPPSGQLAISPPPAALGNTA